MRDIFIINGVGRSGKDTFVEYLRNKNPTVLYSTIERYKTIAYHSFGWDLAKDDRGRKLLSDLKRAAIEYNDKPFKDLVGYIKFQDRSFNKLKVQKPIYAIMIRDIDEIEKIANSEEFADRVLAILITSNRIPQKLGNVADDNVENYYYDYIIENNGTKEEFYEAIDTFWEDFNHSVEEN